LVKQLARRLLPDKVWTRLQSIKATLLLRKLEEQWKQARGELAQVVRAQGGPRRVLIAPADPGSLVGSCGDEAMIEALKTMAAEAHPDVAIHILVDGPHACGMAASLGMTPIDIWGRDDFVHSLVTLLREQCYAAVIGVGADIIDGFYGPPTPAKILVTLDVAARLGIPAVVLGASFSTKPDFRLKPFFDRLDPGVQLLIRDPISLARAQAFTTAPSELVADSAFMLRASEPDPETLKWVQARRAEGKQVIGFNIHPMLLRRAHDDPEKLLIDPAFASLVDVTVDTAVAWLLIPHDNREICSDHSILAPLYERLKTRLDGNVQLFDRHRSAAELKAIAGTLDGVVTGRMHLAIASLGTGTPVLCIAYQDKFEGLLRHFDLPSDSLLGLKQLHQPEIFADRIRTFLGETRELRRHVAEHWPQVLDYSRRNFDVLA